MKRMADKWLFQKEMVLKLEFTAPELVSHIISPKPHCQQLGHHSN